MIWYFLIVVLIAIQRWAFGWLPVVDELPLGMDSSLQAIVGYTNSFKQVFPFVDLLMSAVIWYLAFKLTIMVLKQLRIIKGHG